jgi:hypothetical protein
MISDITWRKVMRIALTHEGVTVESPMIQAYAKRFGLHPEDLETLAKEAEHEKTKKHRVCWKCNGQGQFNTLPPSLCTCEQAERFSTMGGREWNQDLK